MRQVFEMEVDEYIMFSCDLGWMRPVIMMGATEYTMAVRWVETVVCWWVGQSLGVSNEILIFLGDC